MANNKDSDVEGSSDSEVYTIVEESNCSDSSDSRPASSAVYSFDNLLSNGNNLSEKESLLEGKANTYEFVDKYFKSKPLKNLASSESEEEMLVLDEDPATGKEPLVSEVSSKKKESKQLSDDELTLPISLANILPKLHTTCNASGNEESSITNTKFMENSQWEPSTDGELKCISPHNFVQIDSTLLAQPMDVVKTGIDKLEMNEIMPSENADQNINIIGEKILPSFSSADKLFYSELQKIHESPETKTTLRDSKSLLTEEKTKQIIDKDENNTVDSGIVEKNSIEKRASECETSVKIPSQKFTRIKCKETISNSDTDSNCSIKVIKEGLAKTIEDEQNILCDLLQEDKTNYFLNKNLSETNDFSNNVALGETTNNTIDTKEQSKNLRNMTIIVDKSNCHISVNPEIVIESESIYQEDSYSKVNGISLIKPCTVILNPLSLESINLKDEPCSVYNTIFKNLKDIDNQKKIYTKSKKNKSGVCVKSDKQAKAVVKRKKILKKSISQHTAKTSSNRKKTFKISKKWLESKKPPLKFDDIESNIDSEKDNMKQDVQTPENNEKLMNVTSMDNNEESIMMLEVQIPENEEQVNVASTKDNQENVIMQEVLPPENKKQINVTHIHNMGKFLLKENVKVTDFNLSNACVIKPCKIVLPRLPCKNFQMLMDKKFDKCLKSDNEEIGIDIDDEIDRKSNSSIEEDNFRILTPSRDLRLTKFSSVRIKEIESGTSIKNLCISKQQSITKFDLLSSDSEDSDDVEIIYSIQNKRKSKNKFSKSLQNSTFGEIDESDEYSRKANNTDDIIEQKNVKLKNSKSKKKIYMKQTFKHKNIDKAKENLDSSIKSRRIKKNTLQVSKSDQNYFKSDLKDSDINNKINAIDTEQPKRKAEVRPFNSKKNTVVKYDESENEVSGGDEIVFSDSNHSTISSVKISSLGDLYKSFDPSMKKNSLNKQIPKQVADNSVKKAFTNYKKLEQSEYDLDFNSLIKPCKVVIHPLTPDQYLTSYCVELNIPHCNDIDDCSIQYHSKKSSRTKRQFLKSDTDESINDFKVKSRTKSLKNCKQNSRISGGKLNDANKNKLNFEKQDEFEGRTKQKSTSKVTTSDQNNESHFEANELKQFKDGEKEDIYLENNLKGESLNYKGKSKPRLKILSHTKHFANSIKNYIDYNSDSNENNIEHEQSDKLVMHRKKYQLNDKNNDKLKNFSFIDQEGSFSNSSNILPSLDAVPSFNELLATNDHSLEENSLIKSHQIFKETSENIAGFVKEGNMQIKIDQTTDALNFNSLIKPCKVILHRYSFENKRLVMENYDENCKSCNEQLISNCNSGCSKISKKSSKYKKETLKFSDSDDELDDVQDRKEKLKKVRNSDFNKMQYNCDSESDNRSSLPTKKSKQNKNSFDDNRSDSKFNRSKHNAISKVKSLSKRLQKENLHQEHDEFHSDDSIRCEQVNSVRKLGNDSSAESCSTKNDEISDFNLINSGVSDKKDTEVKKNQSEFELSISKKSLQDKVHNSEELFSVNNELTFTDSSCSSVTAMGIPALDELLTTIDNSLENESFLMKDIPKQISNTIDNSIQQKHSKPVIEKLNFTSLIKPCKVILHHLKSDIETDYQIILCNDKYEKEKNVSKKCQKILSHQPKKSFSNEDSSKERKSDSTQFRKNRKIPFAKRFENKHSNKNVKQADKRNRGESKWQSSIINHENSHSSDDAEEQEHKAKRLEEDQKVYKSKTMKNSSKINFSAIEEDLEKRTKKYSNKAENRKKSSKVSCNVKNITSSKNNDNSDSDQNIKKQEKHMERHTRKMSFEINFSDCENSEEPLQKQSDKRTGKEHENNSNALKCFVKNMISDNNDIDQDSESQKCKAKRATGKLESQLIKRLRNDINASKIESNDDNQSIEKPTEGVENQRNKYKEKLFKRKAISTFLEIGSDTSEKDSDQSEDEQSEENRKLKLEKLSTKIKLQMESILSSENSDDQDDLIGQRNKNRPVLKKTLNKTLVKLSNPKLSSTVKQSIKLTSDDEIKSDTDFIKSLNQGKKRKKSLSKHKDHLKINASSESDDSYNQEEEIQLKNKKKKITRA